MAYAYVIAITEDGSPVPFVYSPYNNILVNFSGSGYYSGNIDPKSQSDAYRYSGYVVWEVSSNYPSTIGVTITDSSGHFKTKTATVTRRYYSSSYEYLAQYDEIELEPTADPGHVTVSLASSPTTNNGNYVTIATVTGSSGTAYLGLGSSSSSGPSSWVSSPLQITEAGTYYVWKKCDAASGYDAVSPTYEGSVTVSKQYWDLGSPVDPSAQTYNPSHVLYYLCRTNTGAEGANCTPIVKQGGTTISSDGWHWNPEQINYENYIDIVPPAGQNAGTYVVTGVVRKSTDAYHYKTEGPVSFTITINKASQSAPTAYGSSVYYGSTATATTSGGGGVGSIEWSNGSSRSALGTQYTKARWTGGTNYNASAWSNEVALTVSDYISNSNYSPHDYYASVSIGDGMSAGGGSCTVSASAGHYAYDYWASGTYNNRHWVGDSVTWSIVTNGNSRFSKSGNTLSHSSMGTSVTTDSVTVRAVNSSSSSATKDTSTSISNAVTNWDYSGSNSDWWASASIGDGMSAGGGSCTVTASAGHTHTYYYYYTSGATSGPYYSYPGDSATWSIVSNGNSRFSQDGNTLYHSSMGTAYDTYDTVTVRAVNSVSGSTGDASKSIYNSVDNWDYSGSNGSYWADISIGSGMSAGGGSCTVTASAGHTHTYYHHYTSGSTTGPHTSAVDDSVTWSIVTNGNSRFSKSGNTLSHSSMGTSVTTDSVTVRAVNSSSSSATKDASTSISNAVTNSDYSASNSGFWADVSIGSGMSAGGGSCTVSASAGHTHTYYYLYTSGSTSGPYTSAASDSVTWSITTQTFTPSGGSASNISRFSKSGNTLSHTSMTTNVGTDYVKITATNSSSSSATKDASTSISNAVTNSDYNASNSSYWASVSIGNGMSAAGGYCTVSASAGHTHTYYYYYTSGSTSGPYTSAASDGVSWSITSNGNSRFSKDGNTLYHSDMKKNTTTDTVTVTATNSSSSSATDSASKSISNSITYGNVSAPTITQIANFPAGGVTLTTSNIGTYFSASGSSQTKTWTSGSSESCSISYSWTVTTGGVASLGTSETSTTTSKAISITCTASGEGSKSNSTTKTSGNQEANPVTSISLAVGGSTGTKKITYGSSVTTTVTATYKSGSSKTITPTTVTSSDTTVATVS